MNNPYYDEFISIYGKKRLTVADILSTNPSLWSFDTRIKLVKKYAWAVPSDDAIEAIVRLRQPIVEIGAGNGYWGYLLRQCGITCHLYDSEPPIAGPTRFFDHGVWTNVKQSGPEMVMRHPDAALFLCWPPYNDEMANRCVAGYGGDTIIYVGEGDGGCTGNDAFHERLCVYEEVDYVKLPQFPGINDNLSILKRRKRLSNLQQMV